MGAEVIGFANNIPTNPSHFELLNLKIHHSQGDILDSHKLQKVFDKYLPEIVFHLAAQPIVRTSYNDPVLTYNTNVIGTLNVFEACRKTSSVKVIVNVTSDKCYSNKESIWGYRETDRLGGYDPYSSSKACSEILSQSYRDSFFNKSKFEDHGVSLATVRAGNVIGGGDWAKDRLIPDIMIAISKNQNVNIRFPNAVRPWQHVLEPLSGYLLLASELFSGKNEYSDAWNFGPNYKDTIPVHEIVRAIQDKWHSLKYKVQTGNDDPHETTLLRLDCSKAEAILKWNSILTSEKTLQLTIDWYKKFYSEKKICSKENILEYVNMALNSNSIWTKNNI